MSAPRATPPWLYPLIALLAAVNPLTHLWLLYGLPEGLSATGFHIGDTPFFLTAMSAARNVDFAPYALCDASGAFGASSFALPHHYLYIALGHAAHALGVPDFLLLGLANALCGVLYLWAVWSFMRVALLRVAPRAFLLFTLGGGVAGALYLLAWLAGHTDSAGFEGWFHRYARYELIEGPFLAPLLIVPRLYYTLPLAMGFAALTCCVRRCYRAPAAHAGARDLAMAVLLLGLSTLLNARVGLLLFGALLCLLVVAPAAPRVRLRWGIVCGVLVLGVGLAVGALLAGNAAASENVRALLQRSIWFGALLGATVLAVPALLVSLRMPLRALSTPLRFVLGALLGYLAAFALLYAMHQVYWGNLLAGGDARAAVAVSDWALLGALPGALLAARRARKAPAAGISGALALWLAGAVAVGISAWGGGALLTAMPERTLAVCAVPLALLTARGLHQRRLRDALFPARNATPFLRVYARHGFTILIAAGLLSNTVAALCFQGPLGYDAAPGPFAWVHSEVMASEDAHLIDAIESGVVLAPASLPPLLGDVVVHRRPGTRTVLGQPSLEFSGVLMAPLIQRVQQFYDPALLESFDHRAQLDRWCVDYVLCPQTRPVDPATLSYFRAQPYLEEVLGERDIALFRVRQEAMP
jgi:hypothetical protein